MYSIATMIDELTLSTRGQIFLVNLKQTVDSGIDVTRLREVCAAHARLASGQLAQRLTPDELAVKLGEQFVSAGVWLESAVPDISRYRSKQTNILSRVTTYSRFYSLLRGRNGHPADELPEPQDLSDGHRSEIEPEQVARARLNIDNGAWRDVALEPDLRFSSFCVWVLPLSELERRTARNRRPLADFYRDVIGLCHLGPGEHLIRLDFDLETWSIGSELLRRRPHGASNGSARFKMHVESSCNWGRTVNLQVIAKRRNRPLEGVPEMLLAPFEIPVEQISAHYIGEIQQPAEQNDAFFLHRIAQMSIPEVVTSLKGALG